MENLLIIGIDPGTTTGIAAVNFDGDLVLTASRKNFSKSKITSFISSLGKPLIIASDISTTPKLLEKISANLPTRLISPKTDLKKREKNEMVKAYSEKLNSKKLWNNSHEKDALASALFAYGKLKPLIERVKKRLDSDDILERDVREYVMRNVLLHNFSVTSSINQYPDQFFKYKIARIR